MSHTGDQFEPSDAGGENSAARPARMRKPTQKANTTAEASNSPAIAMSPRATRVRQASLRHSYVDDDGSDVDEEEEEEEEEEADHAIDAAATENSPLPPSGPPARIKRPYKKRGSTAAGTVVDGPRKKRKSTIAAGEDANQDTAAAGPAVPRVKRAYTKRQNKVGPSDHHPTQALVAAPPIATGPSIEQVQAENAKAQLELQQARNVTYKIVLDMTENMDQHIMRQLLAQYAANDKALIFDISVANNTMVKHLMTLANHNPLYPQGLDGAPIAPMLGQGSMGGGPGLGNNHLNGYGASHQEVHGNGYGNPSPHNIDPFDHDDQQQASTPLTQQQRLEQREIKANQWTKAKIAHLIPDGLLPPITGPVPVGIIKNGQNVVNAGFDYRLRLHWRLTKKDREGRTIEYDGKTPATKRSDVDLHPSLQGLNEEQFAAEILKRQWEQDRRVSTNEPLLGLQ